MTKETPEWRIAALRWSAIPLQCEMCKYRCKDCLLSIFFSWQRKICCSYETTACQRNITSAFRNTRGMDRIRKQLRNIRAFVLASCFDHKICVGDITYYSCGCLEEVSSCSKSHAKLACSCCPQQYEHYDCSRLDIPRPVRSVLEKKLSANKEVTKRHSLFALR